MLPGCLFQRDTSHYGVNGLPESYTAGPGAHRMTVYGSSRPDDKIGPQLLHQEGDCSLMYSSSGHGEDGRQIVERGSEHLRYLEVSVS